MGSKHSVPVRAVKSHAIPSASAPEDIVIVQSPERKSEQKDEQRSEWYDEHDASILTGLSEYLALSADVASHDEKEPQPIRVETRIDKTIVGLPRIVIIHKKRSVLVNWALRVIGATKNIQVKPDENYAFIITGKPTITDPIVAEVVNNNAMPAPTVLDFGAVIPVMSPMLANKYIDTIDAIVSKYPPVFKTPTVRYNITTKITELKRNAGLVHALSKRHPCEDHYIYLVHNGKHLAKGIETYKVGRTNCPERRMHEYPEGTKIIMIRQCIDDVAMEQIILSAFRGKAPVLIRTSSGTLKITGFEPVHEDGLEYFRGDKTLMVRAINELMDAEENP